ncbi:MAG: hypothetical protein LBP75_04235 [Planctomycetota bacterium]|jgi:hypothetical protein|nr:hypothetical protein [Planctomycetota bacterium]
MRRLFIWLLPCLCAGVLAAEPQPVNSQPLSAAQTDQILDRIFAQQKQLTRLAVKVTSRKIGGIFSGSSTTTWGEAFAQMPDMLLFIDHGDLGKSGNPLAYVLIDGSYLWDMKPGDGGYEAERLDLKNAGDRDLNIASLLIGATVNNSRELREYYEVSGTRDTFGAGGAGESYHFRFQTRPDKSRDNKDEASELWIRDGEIIPWFLRVTAKVKKTDVFSGETTYKNSVSEKEFTEVRTNLSNPPLPPFRVTDTFYVGQLLVKYRGTKVLEKGSVIPNAQLTNDLKILLSRLQGKQQ